MVADTSMKAEIGKLIAATILYSFVNSIVSRAWRVRSMSGVWEEGCKMYPPSHAGWREGGKAGTEVAFLWRPAAASTELFISLACVCYMLQAAYVATSHWAEQLLFYPPYHRHLPRFCSPTWQALGEWSIYLERHTLFTVPILRFKVAQSFTTIVLHIHVNKWRSSSNFGLVNHWSGLREDKMYTNINPETEVDCSLFFSNCSSRVWQLSNQIEL